MHWYSPEIPNISVQDVAWLVAEAAWCYTKGAAPMDRFLRKNTSIHFFMRELNEHNGLDLTETFWNPIRVLISGSVTTYLSEMLEMRRSSICTDRSTTLSAAFFSGVPFQVSHLCDSQKTWEVGLSGEVESGANTWSEVGYGSLRNLTSRREEWATVHTRTERVSDVYLSRAGERITFSRVFSLCFKDIRGHEKMAEIFVTFFSFSLDGDFIMALLFPTYFEGLVVQYTRGFASVPKNSKRTTLQKEGKIEKEALLVCWRYRNRDTLLTQIRYLSATSASFLDCWVPDLLAISSVMNDKRNEDVGPRTEEKKEEPFNDGNGDLSTRRRERIGQILRESVSTYK